MRGLAIVFILFLGQCCLAQSFSGLVIDDETEDPLIGANVQVVYGSDTIFTSTSSVGVYELSRADELTSLQVSYLGYITQKWVPGDGDIGTFRLQVDESNIAVNPIIIANPFLSNDVSFNRKEFQVLPGAYEDPSRLLLKAPGFTTANDQANSILYKGFPSNLINWNVNNALIINPNHLSNAGTLSDVSSANAGGVNMFSGQVIGTYDFQSAPYNFPGNDAVAGNSNIEFSDYNNSYLNLSLVGLEAGLGVKAKNGLPGGQLNYRYSTVGILTGPLGLDFGGEEIVYQDLFAKLDFIQKDDEKLNAFITVGISHNYKDSLAVRDSAMIFKDVQNISFDSRIIVSGLKYEKKWENLQLNAAVNYSNKSDARESSSSVPFLRTVNDLRQSMLSGVMNIRKGNLKTGLRLSNLNDKLVFLKSMGDVTSLIEKDSKNTNIFPYASYDWQFNNTFITGGSGLSFNTLTSNAYFEPFVKGISELTESLDLEVSFRRNSQLVVGSNFNYMFEPQEIVGNHSEIFLKYKKPKFIAYVNGFYHYMTNILKESDSFYSQFTGVNRTNIGDYDYEGKARIQGFSTGASTRNLIVKNLNLNANATFFSANYSSDEADWTENTFDFNQSYNLLVSYQRKLKKDKEWLVSFAYHTRGGLNEFLIDGLGSEMLLEVEYDFSQAPSRQLSPYTRMDFRFVYNLRKGTHRKFAKSFSIDIQNIANRENDAFGNYDFLNNEPFVQTQLGLIPILAYRIEF